MSGFEIAGVVLGSMPLIISALEFYHKGIATAKRFWRYKKEFRVLIDQIDTERGIFINTLEQLLTGVVRVEHMSGFLSNPVGEAWRDASIEAKLKDRLRAAYQIYMKNINGMEMRSKEMREKLALNADGTPQFSEPNAFKREYKRLKFSIATSEYMELVTHLRSHNQALARLTKQSLELEPSRAAEGKTKYPDFRALQSHARSTYTSLRSGWRCACEEHAVSLRLECRNKSSKEDSLEQTTFRVIFSYTSVGSSPTPQWPMWQAAEIRRLVETPEHTSSSHTALSAQAVQSSQRHVRFHDAVFTSPVIAATTSSSPGQPATTHPSAEQIEDLCRAFNKLQSPQRDLCIGYLLDGLKRKHAIYLEPSPSQQQWAAYSLKEVLAQTSKLHRRLTQHDKLKLAVDLASSVLQLYNTPWLEEQWGKDDVYFIHRPEASSASVFEHPFVCRKFGAQVVSTAETTTTSTTACRVIRNQTLFALGILLIELWYGKPIEELQTVPDLDCAGTPGVTWCTAERLVEHEMEFDAGKRYSDAVRRCIRCNFDSKETSLNNESFQQLVYDGVVKLLEKTLQQFHGLD